MLIYILQIYYSHCLALVIFWWSLWGFLCRGSCHLQTMRVLLLFQFGFLLFLFLLCLLGPKLPKLLNSSGESGHPCLVPDFRGNAFNFSQLRIMFAVCLSLIAFIMLRYILSIPAFWRVFIINGCWILSKAFSASIEIIIWLLCFDLLMWWITLIDLQILKNPCISGIKPTWSWCMIFLMCCWILQYLQINQCNTPH